MGTAESAERKVFRTTEAACPQNTKWQCDVPGGVGRYSWTVTGGVLPSTLISEPFSGTQVLAHDSWSHTH